MANDELGKRIYRFALVFFLAPIGLGFDWIATGVVVVLLFFLEGPRSAYDAIHRFVDRWRRFYSTGEWDWDLLDDE